MQEKVENYVICVQGNEKLVFVWEMDGKKGKNEGGGREEGTMIVVVGESEGKGEGEGEGQEEGGRVRREGKGGKRARRGEI